jgi:hypothetical protein
MAAVVATAGAFCSTCWTNARVVSTSRVTIFCTTSRASIFHTICRAAIYRSSFCPTGFVTTSRTACRAVTFHTTANCHPTVFLIAAIFRTTASFRTASRASNGHTARRPASFRSTFGLGIFRTISINRTSVCILRPALFKLFRFSLPWPGPRHSESGRCPL